MQKSVVNHTKPLLCWLHVYHFVFDELLKENQMGICTLWRPKDHFPFLLSFFFNLKWVQERKRCHGYYFCFQHRRRKRIFITKTSHSDSLWNRAWSEFKTGPRDMRLPLAHNIKYRGLSYDQCHLTQYLKGTPFSIPMLLCPEFYACIGLPDRDDSTTG